MGVRSAIQAGALTLFLCLLLLWLTRSLPVCQAGLPERASPTAVYVWPSSVPASPYPQLPRDLSVQLGKPHSPRFDSQQHVVCTLPFALPLPFPDIGEPCQLGQWDPPGSSDQIHPRPCWRWIRQPSLIQSSCWRAGPTAQCRLTGPIPAQQQGSRSCATRHKPFMSCFSGTCPSPSLLPGGKREDPGHFVSLSGQEPRSRSPPGPPLLRPVTGQWLSCAWRQPHHSLLARALTWFTARSCKGVVQHVVGKKQHRYLS